MTSQTTSLPELPRVLSDEQITALWKKYVGTPRANFTFARAIESAVASALQATFPTPNQGERYAGVVLGEEGKPSHHLFLLTDDSGKRMPWDAAVEWARSVGGDLPTRFESVLLYANLRDQFDQRDWHWTGTQCSDAFAWVQSLSSGGQDYGRKRYEFRARAVRRLPIASNGA